MLKEENSVLREKLETAVGDASPPHTSRAHAKLESEVNKLARQKTALQSKVRMMEMEIRELISDEERDIQRLNGKGHRSTDESF